MQKDPIERLAKRLIEEGICTQAELDAIASDADKLLAEAIDEAEAAPSPVCPPSWPTFIRNKEEIL